MCGSCKRLTTLYIVLKDLQPSHSARTQASPRFKKTLGLEIPDGTPWSSDFDGLVPQNVTKCISLRIKEIVDVSVARDTNDNDWRGAGRKNLNFTEVEGAREEQQYFNIEPKESRTSMDNAPGRFALTECMLRGAIRELNAFAITF
ncbi:hypothetical protein CEP54_015992 [Fusarium duplospermum]|uniref:Uncharacterized protein n=1 Tax=Fusarium duplospermum TaxID=1325734 RepID=A0A428NJB1_9HYPO|nr:hypothetical protein CEP54_015992 [Fusarium duplospermum]